MSVPTTEILKNALDQAATDHGVYEATVLGGVHDVEWPTWYADHMSQALANDGYNLALAAEEKPKETSTLELKLEVLVLPVTDVDRAKEFYEKAGFRVDADFNISENFRIIQLTPPGSEMSIIFGKGVTESAPGSVQNLHLIVKDIVAAQSELHRRGIDISEVWHDADGLFHQPGGRNRISGPSPDRADYGSFASFSDPDGNGWFLQEVLTRAPGR
ncbi:VOC family protein [Paenarthrobacter sp. NPDC056912]|uniref:VOC family protein n=1 Tax=Paenarthrobacter sp. NPDC056912 TaxID=3345965 RepID=UPI00366E933B